MEFIPGPAVTRVLCADCGESLSMVEKLSITDKIRNSHCPQLGQLVCCVSKEYVSPPCITVLDRVELLLYSVDITEGIPKQCA